MDSFRLRRIRHGVSASDIARLLGFSVQAVLLYEKSKGRHWPETDAKYERALAELIRQRTRGA